MKVSERLHRLVVTEKEIENSILEYLAARKILAWKNQSVGVFDPTKQIFRKSFNRHHRKGVSDILGVYRGKFLAIEVKSVKGRLSPEQEEFLAAVKEAGGISCVACSIEDVVEALNAF